ncbi:MAG: OmpA family protein [Saprospiraceae bacterium]
MSINLLDLVKDQVTGALTKQASSFLGESESSVGSALGAIMPTLLGSVVQKSNNAAGAQGIMDMIGKLDLGSLSNIASVFGGGASNVNNLMNSGGGIVDALLGNKTSGIIDLISKVSGLKSGSSSSLMKLAAPFLMSVIGNQIKGKGVSFLTDLLGGQKSYINNALPAGMGSLLGFADSSSTHSSRTTSTTTHHTAPKGNGNGWLKWLLPLLLVAAVLYWLSSRGCGNKVMETASDVAAKVDTMATNTVNAVDTLASSAANFFTKKLSTGFELLNASANGVENQLVTFIEDGSKVVDKTTWFNFDRLLFDTGKATLQPSSQEQLKNVAEILKAFPNVSIKLGGYTDNVGDPKSNLKLSTDRANTVKAELVGMGIDHARIETEGYGQEHPVASNDTEEGRQQNRRIGIRVTKK